MGYLEDLLYQVANWFAGLINNFLSSLGSFFNQILINFQSMLGALTSALNTAFQEIVNTFRNIATLITNAFNTIANAIQAALQNLWTNLYNGTVALINSVGSVVNNAIAQIQSWVQTAIAGISTFVQNITNNIRTFIQTAFDAIVTAFNNTVQAASNAIATLLNAARAAVVANENAITAAWQNLVSGSQSLVTTMLSQVANLAEAFRSSTAGLAQTISEGHAHLSDELAKQILVVLHAVLPEPKPNEWGDLQSVPSALMQGRLTVEEFRDIISSVTTRMMGTTGLQRSLFHGLMAAAIAAPGFWTVGQAYSNLVLQELAMVLPYNVLTPADAVLAYRRQSITQEQAAEVIRKAGFSERDAFTIVQNSTQVPPPGDLLVAWNRGLIGDGQLDSDLFQIGFAAEWRRLLKELAKPIPPVQDLITMAVREAFSPDIAQTFGQYEDLPAAFVLWAGKQGLTEDWASRYWAAHWALPSPDQGFEMLHRGIINETELQLLLRALDVMPFWREKLTGISYNVFTRVDVRRMHQLGILDEAGVYKAHQEMGYNAEKASALTAFVLKLNENKPSDDDVELGSLTRATIINWFKDGLLDEGRAAELLITAGNTPQAAGTYIVAAQMDLEREDRKAETAIIIDSFKAGIYTYEEAVDKLHQLSLSTLEVKKATDALIKAQKTLVKLPTLADGAKFYENGLIDRATFADLLRRLGYAPVWVAAYIALSDKDIANAQNGA